MSTPEQDAWVFAFSGTNPAAFAGATPADAAGVMSASPAGNAGGHGNAPPTNTKTVNGPKAPDASKDWVLQTIYIEPDHPSVPTGETLQFDALGIYLDGHTQPETDALIWRSTDPKTVSFDNSGKRGLATVHKEGQVTISAMEPNSKKIGTTTLKALPPPVSQMSEDDLDKGDAYRIGVEDGNRDDTVRRGKFESPAKPELLAAYDDGFQDGLAQADAKWDKVGAELHDAPSSKTPEEGKAGFEETLGGAGIVLSMVSALEARSAILAAGGSAIGAGAAATTISMILLPVSAFLLGTAIAQRREDYKKAVDQFVSKFIALTLFEALERARAMVKSTTGSVKELNDDGLVASHSIYTAMEKQLDSTLRDYVDDKAAEPKFEALYKTWAAKLSKQYANIMSNPRFRKE